MFAYLLLIVVSMVLGFSVQGYCKHNLRKYENEASSLNITGLQAAQFMLNRHGVTGVSIYAGQEGADHFDPRDNSISLSPSVYYGRSITAIATACHEVGHACQKAQGYSFFNFRSALVPVVNFTQSTWMFILIAGVFLNMIGLVDLAILFYAFAVLFQIVTLPVELNASHRAQAYITELGVPQFESKGSFKVLRACALTYVAAALISIMNLLYLLSVYNDD